MNMCENSSDCMCWHFLFCYEKDNSVKLLQSLREERRGLGQGSHKISLRTQLLNCCGWHGMAYSSHITGILRKPDTWQKINHRHP